MSFLIFILAFLPIFYLKVQPTQAASVNIDCSVGSPRTIAQGVDFNSGDDLTLTGSGTCVLNSAVTLNTFTLGDGVDATILTHDSNTDSKTNYIDITTTGSITILANAQIDVSEKGYTATYGDGAGEGIAGSGIGAGAGYGGAGGDSDNGTGEQGGSTYGDASNPNDLGSGGGSGFNSVGGSGGGLVRLTSNTTLTFNGWISSNGGNGSGENRGGGGSGGGVYLNALTVEGSGTIITDGGEGGSFGGGGGGGGRIAVLSLTDNSSYTTQSFGGISNGTGESGANGTTQSVTLTVPSTPVVSSPANKIAQLTVNPTLTSNVYSSNGSPHSTTDWKITTDSAGNSIVWSSLDDATNLTSIVVNASNGNFSGDLAGQTALAEFTLYYMFVRHTNSVGDSSWSPTGYSFTTEYTGSSDEQVWEFDDATPGDVYDFNASVIEINASSNSKAQLIDGGGGSYPALAIDGNTKRKAITLSNSGAELTNHQIKLEINNTTGLYDSDMQDDFDDIRFSNGTGTELDYWIESQTAAPNPTAVVWVEVDSIAANPSSTTIYLNYGNAGLSSESNIGNTFVFGDDFTGASLNTSKWPASTGASVSGGELTLTGAGYVHATGSAIGTDTVFFIKQKSLTSQIGRFGLNSAVNTFYGGGSEYVGYQYYADGFIYTDTSGSGGGFNQTKETTYPSNTYVETMFERISTTSVNMYSDGVLLATYTTNIPTGSNVYPLIENDVVVDYVYVRKYTSQTITPSYGSEETTYSYDQFSLTPSAGGEHPSYTRLISFSASASGSGTPVYQISADGTNWYYHNGSAWTAVSTNSTDNNSATEINTYIPNFSSEVGTGDIYFKAFLPSNGSDDIALNNITVAYDNGSPIGLANFAKDSNTATTATFTWDPVTDGAFTHYEIWYGTNQTDVQNRTGTAIEWDNSDDAALATVGTATTTITGLTQDTVYYAKIFAIDGFANEATVADISFDTNAGAPSGLADLTKSSNTATEVTLTWTAATDPTFDHYEIWYGDNQSDVQNRTGTATEWDDSDDADLATAGTTTTTITGLTTGTTYYAKIWAIDSFAAETTIDDITFIISTGSTTKTVPQATSISGTSTGTDSTTDAETDDSEETSSDEEEVLYGLDRLRIKLNTPEEDTWIAVGYNHLLQGASYIQISQLDARLDELLEQGYATVYFIFKYKGVLSPVYSKVLDNTRPEIIDTKPEDSINDELLDDIVVDDYEDTTDSENQNSYEDNLLESENGIQDKYLTDESTGDLKQKEDDIYIQDPVFEDITIEKDLRVDGDAIAEIVSLRKGDLFKIQGHETVYVFGEDGRRHVFPNQFVFKSYYDDFSDVTEFSVDQVGEIPIGENRKMSPGTWLVKIVDDPRVYAVEPGGILRWVQTEELAEKLYGESWNRKVLDIEPALFSEYTMGPPIIDPEHPDGVLVTYDEDEGDNDVIYYVRDAQLFEVSNIELRSFGARKNFIEVIDEEDFDYVKSGILNDLL